MVPSKKWVSRSTYLRGMEGEEEGIDTVASTRDADSLENDDEITIYKSLGIAAEDIFSAYHIYQKIQQDKS